MEGSRLSHLGKTVGRSDLGRRRVKNNCPRKQSSRKKVFEPTGPAF